MKQQAAALFAILSAAWLGSADPAQAQLRPQTHGPAPVVVLPPPIILQPDSTQLKPTPLAPTMASPSLVVVPPPPVAAEAAVDGGDSACRCPDGQTADVEGWCWRRTDAASGYWAKTEKCQR